MLICDCVSGNHGALFDTDLPESEEEAEMTESSSDDSESEGPAPAHQEEEPLYIIRIKRAVKKAIKKGTRHTEGIIIVSMYGAFQSYLTIKISEFLCEWTASLPQKTSCLQ